MLNGAEWYQLHENFPSTADRLLARIDECLAHLELIDTDADAIDCIYGCLANLHEEATEAGVAGISLHCLHLLRLLRMAQIAGSFGMSLLPSLRQCLDLLAWQVELINPRSGQLLLDDSEQLELLEQLAINAGLTEVEHRRVTEPRWHYSQLLAKSFTAGLAIQRKAG